MKKIFYIIIIIIISLAFTACIKQENPPILANPIEPPIIDEPIYPPVEPVTDPVEVQINEMTLEEKIGQLMIVGLEGKEIDENEIRNIHQYKVSGFIFFSRNIDNAEQTLSLLNSLKEENKTNSVPLFLSIDEEGGLVSRLSKIYRNLPTAAKLGNSNDNELSFEYGKNLGIKASSLGFNINFAPVLDINSNPNNPVIGNRSYGNEPELVSDVGIEVMNGIKSQNIIAIPKHFPGHGNTSVDSHLELPVIHKSLDELYNLEIIPFKRAIDYGVDAIMVSHILFPQIDDKYPATMSEEIIDRILREELGFNGVVISDDMTMGAIVDNYTIEEASVQFLKSGGDIVLVCHKNENVESVYNKIIDSVNDGELTEYDINEKVYRILTLKREYEIEDKSMEAVNIKKINSNTEKLIKDING